MGGMAGFDPVAMTPPRLAVKLCSPTVTVRGPVSRPYPRTNRPPLPSKRATANDSSQSPATSALMRAATPPPPAPPPLGPPPPRAPPFLGRVPAPPTPGFQIVWLAEPLGGGFVLAPRE